MNITFKTILCVGLCHFAAVLCGKAEPQNILESATYQSPKDLDSTHKFLGKFLPKRLFLILSEKDKYLTQRLLLQALETSPSYLDTKWNNLDNQHRGSILVYPAEDVEGTKCRKFLVRFYINDEGTDVYGRACRINKEWQILD
jgi:surface antigen